MRQIKSERGYAMLIVLLLVTVMSLMALTLTSVTISQAQQVSISTQKLQATKVAEMGLKDYQALIQQEVNQIQSQKIDPSKVDALSVVKSSMDSIPKSYQSSDNHNLDDLSGDVSYDVERNPGDPSDGTYNSSDRTLTWVIKSTGREGNETKTITDTLLISFVNTVNQSGNGLNITPDYMGISLPFHNGSITASGSVRENIDQTSNFVQVGSIIQRQNVNSEMSSVQSQFNAMPHPKIFQNAYIDTDVDSNMILKGQHNQTTEENIYLNGNVNQQQGTFSIHKSFTVNGYYFVNGVFGIAPSSQKNFIFYRTVYINGDLTINVGYGSTVEFLEGIVCNGDVTINVQSNSTVKLGEEQQASTNYSTVSLFYLNPIYSN